MANIELLQQTMQYIRDNPEEWDQSYWGCGTTACFAGHAVRLTGAKLLHYGDSLFADYCLPLEAGNPVDIAEHARRVLELGNEVSQVLFNANNTLEDLEAIVDALINGDDDRLANLYADIYGVDVCT